jgi:hypothetical protein
MEVEFGNSGIHLGRYTFTRVVRQFDGALFVLITIFREEASQESLVLKF